MVQTSSRRHGDFTGQVKAQQAKEAAEEQEERALELALAAEAEAVAVEEGLFDPRTQDRIDDAGVAEIVDDAVQVVDAEPEKEHTTRNALSRLLRREEDDEPVLTGKEDAETLNRILSRRRQAPELPVDIIEVENAVVRIRTNEDIDDMTFGMTPTGQPNNYSFKEGLQYEVSYPIYEHLRKRGLIRSVR